MAGMLRVVIRRDELGSGFSYEGLPAQIKRSLGVWWSAFHRSTVKGVQK